MRIERILLQNYRQYKKIDFNFDSSSKYDLNMIIATNGTGKTNLLNAINWCLYGEEISLSKKSKSSPIINKNAIRNSNDEESVSVKIWVTNQRKNDILFSRNAFYKIQSKENIIERNTELTVEMTDDIGNTKILEGNDAEDAVERFVPENIKEFFFFDGERLDNYFKKATGENIKKATFKISQIDVLSKIEKNLDTLLKRMIKKAGKEYPDVEEAEKKLNSINLELKNIENKKRECEVQIHESKSSIDIINSKMVGSPDIDAYKEERKNIMETQTKKIESLEKKKIEKDATILKKGKLVLLLPAIETVLDVIAEKKVNKEYPPSIDIDIVDEILKKDKCSICGTFLDNESKIFVTKLHEFLTSVGDDSKKLKEMEDYLKFSKIKALEIKSDLFNLTSIIEEYKDDNINLQNRINSIDQKLEGHDEKKVNNWIRELKSFEETLGRNERKIGRLESKEETLKKDFQKWENELSSRMNKRDELKEINIQKEFCTKSLYSVVSTKESIINQTREKIESRTKVLFFELIWKKHTFKDITINDNYEINVIDSDGYQSLGSLGAAERQLLALAFTLALHEVSGFNSPILIDTPVGRVSDKQRENFAITLLNTSLKKQIILLFTPSEYSNEISKVLENKSNNKFNVELSSDEMEVMIKK